MRDIKRSIIAGVLAVSLVASCAYTAGYHAEAETVSGGSTLGNVSTVTTGSGITTSEGIEGGKEEQPQVQKPVAPEKIKLNKKKAYVIPGKSIKLKATVKPANASQEVKWTATGKNKKCVKVKKNGTISAKKKKTAGKTVTIVATSAENAKIKATCKVTIVRKVKSIQITGKSMVFAGKSIQLKAKVKPSNATIKSVKWTSSKKKYATVSSKGKVKTKKSASGKSVLITATAKDGSKVNKKYYIWIR